MMEIKQMLLEALRAYLTGGQVEWSEGVSGEDWAAFFRTASIQNILPMVYEAVYRCPAMRATGQGLSALYKRQVFQSVMLQTAKTAEFLSLYRKLLDGGLKPLAVKGIICRTLYPNPDYRMSGDEDVFLPREQYPACHALFLEEGMYLAEPEKDIYAEGEVPYRKQNGALYIELHKELFSSDAKAYGELNRFFDGAFDRAIRQEIDGVQVWTMGHTDHFLYLILHAFKHFIHSGFGIRQVCDIVRYAGAFGREIDWDYVLRACREVYAERFAASLLQIGTRYLTLDLDRACCPQAWREIPVDCEPMLDDLLSGSVFGAADRNRQHSATITLNAVAADRAGKKGKSSVLRSVFPTAKELSGRYPYLEKRPWLLPVAWASRILRYQKELRAGGGGNDAGETIQIGEQRVELLRTYGIIQ